MKRGVIYFCLLCVVTQLTGCGSVGIEQSPVPESSRQMLLVVGDGVDLITGKMIRFQRESESAPWVKTGEPILITLGRSGLAWGRGLHTVAPSHRPQKREGDGKSPAGVFTLGTAFGFEPLDSLSSMKMPYFKIASGHEGVDDSKSVYYNQIVLRDTIENIDWSSAEVLSDYTVPYNYGIVVNHNVNPVRPGYGSQIFMHIWRAPGRPTAGCTAMEEPHLKALLDWLDDAQNPILVQLPWEWYSLVRLPWNLPQF